MPCDDPDGSDPMLLVGVELPAGPDADRDMAWAFAEELARLGYSAPEIVSVFKQPWYAGAHRAYVTLGDSAIDAIVRQTVEVFGRMRIVDRTPTAAGRDAAAPHACVSCAGKEPDHE
jgi:hypothetical protein